MAMHNQGVGNQMNPSGPINPIPSNPNGGMPINNQGGQNALQPAGVGAPGAPGNVLPQ